MSDPYFRVSASERTKEIYNDFFNHNKNEFGTKANLFRAVVSNIEYLSKINPNYIDPEKQELQNKLKEAEDRIFALETMVQYEKKGEDRDNQIIEKLTKIDKMVEAIFVSDIVNVTDKSDIDLSDPLEFKQESLKENSPKKEEGMFFSSPRLGR